MMTKVAISGLVFGCFVAVLATAAETCNLSCKDSLCFTNYSEAVQCIKSIPFTDSWRNSTLDTLISSLENYGFLDIYKNSGAPYNYRIDILAELKARRAKTYDFDSDFQSDLQSLLQRLQDAHTRYTKPTCYAATFQLPVAFNITLEGGIVRYHLMPSVGLAKYSSVYPLVNVESLLGREVSLLDGLEIETAITQWSDENEDRSNDQAIRYNVGIRDYLHRNLRSFNAPATSDVTFTFTDGTKATLPWMVSYTSDFGNAAKCVKTVTKSAEDQPSTRFVEEYQRLEAEPLKADHREVILAPGRNSSISCFTNVDSKKGDTLVIKIGSFSPPGELYMDAWTDFIHDLSTCLSSKYEFVVVDVAQNGGGYVCLGLRSLTMLVKEFNEDHNKVQMYYDLPSSAFMKKYIKATEDPNPFWLPKEVEQIMEPVTGKAFPNGSAWFDTGRKVVQGGIESERSGLFWLNCTEAMGVLPDFKPTKFPSKDELVVITDGTCGSTCAGFTKIMQEADKATIIGTGGLWYQPMDIASFAGGFVCNPDILGRMAARMNETFPSFETSVRWQFDWAVWYSALQPTRPIQMTFQPAEFRLPFWNWPHPSLNSTFTSSAVSSFYDKVVQLTIEKKEASSGSGNNLWKPAAIASFAVLGVVLMSFTVYLIACRPRARREQVRLLG